MQQCGINPYKPYKYKADDDSNTCLTKGEGVYVAIRSMGSSTYSFQTWSSGIGEYSMTDDAYFDSLSPTYSSEHGKYDQGSAISVSVSDKATAAARFQEGFSSPISDNVGWFCYGNAFGNQWHSISTVFENGSAVKTSQKDTWNKDDFYASSSTPHQGETINVKFQHNPFLENSMPPVTVETAYKADAYFEVWNSTTGRWEVRNNITYTGLAVGNTALYSNTLTQNGSNYYANPVISEGTVTIPEDTITAIKICQKLSYTKNYKFSYDSSNSGGYTVSYPDSGAGKVDNSGMCIKYELAKPISEEDQWHSISTVFDNGVIAKTSNKDTWNKDDFYASPTTPRKGETINIKFQHNPFLENTLPPVAVETAYKTSMHFEVWNSSSGQWEVRNNITYTGLTVNETQLNSNALVQNGANYYATVISEGTVTIPEDSITAVKICQKLCKWY